MLSVVSGMDCLAPRDIPTRMSINAITAIVPVTITSLIDLLMQKEAIVI